MLMVDAHHTYLRMQIHKLKILMGLDGILDVVGIQ